MSNPQILKLAIPLTDKQLLRIMRRASFLYRELELSPKDHDAIVISAQDLGKSGDRKVTLGTYTGDYGLQVITGLPLREVERIVETEYRSGFWSRCAGAFVGCYLFYVLKWIYLLAS